MNGDEFDILVRCWTFPKVVPKVVPKVKELWTCCGEHTEQIKKTIECVQWTEVIQGLRDQLEALWKHKDTIYVACVDKGGKKKSVAVATALTQLCLKKGLLCTGPYHLCKDNWEATRICSTCQHCRPNQEKEDMYEQLRNECAW